MGKATWKWRPSFAALPGAPKGCKHPIGSFCVHAKCAPVLSVLSSSSVSCVNQGGASASQHVPAISAQHVILMVTQQIND